MEQQREDSQISSDSATDANTVPPLLLMQPWATALLTGAYVALIAGGVMSVFLSRINYVLGVGILILCVGLTYLLHHLTKTRHPLPPVAAPWPLEHDEPYAVPASSNAAAPRWPRSL